MDKRTEILAVNLKRLREAKHMSYRRLAEVTNLSVSSLVRWESGESFPRSELLEILADYYGIQVDVLYTRKLTKAAINQVRQSIEKLLYDLGKQTELVEIIDATLQSNLGMVLDILAKFDMEYDILPQNTLTVGVQERENIKRDYEMSFATYFNSIKDNMTGIYHKENAKKIADGYRSYYSGIYINKVLLLKETKKAVSQKKPLPVMKVRIKELKPVLTDNMISGDVYDDIAVMSLEECVRIAENFGMGIKDYLKKQA